MPFELNDDALLATSGPELLADILPRVVRRLAQPAGSAGRLLVDVRGSRPRPLPPPIRKLAAFGYGASGGRDCSK